ncbi:hypothetical protein NQ315_011558 [Exocentrus adspersus]|uniref:Peptidase S1 domain-containing protein n=1 Tax=Exocentrus adspersus TaxID=1586481 RepID=A0AAV8VWS4_9CUCU|nr:hypothetical protein NQ315_011558 [Exocentrus adspersus]
MKTAIYFCAVLSCAVAAEEVNWTSISTNDVEVDPLPTAPVGPVEKIVGGSEVIPNSIPYQVALIIDSTSFCGGSLISRDWVLTAAHCTTGASFVRVVLGAHNLRRGEATTVMLTTSSIINHPQYNRATLTNDVALIRLPFSVRLTRAIQLVTLAPANSPSFAGSVATLSGWGKTGDNTPAISSTLNSVNVNVIANSLCQQTYGGLIQPYTICTYGGARRGGCHGDSGGPLTVNGYQVGVVSFVSSWGCQSGTPTAFSRVSYFRNWIAAHTGV